jgi:hypothetical protein
LFVPSEYLFLCARRKFGFNKKTGQKLLFVYYKPVYHPNSYTTPAERGWAGGIFLTQWEKSFSSPRAASVIYLEEPIRLPSPPQNDFSVHLSVCLKYEKT